MISKSPPYEHLVKRETFLYLHDLENRKYSTGSIINRWRVYTAGCYLITYFVLLYMYIMYRKINVHVPASAV